MLRNILIATMILGMMTWSINSYADDDNEDNPPVSTSKKTSSDDSDDDDQDMD